MRGVCPGFCLHKLYNIGYVILWVSTLPLFRTFCIMKVALRSVFGFLNLHLPLTGYLHCLADVMPPRKSQGTADVTVAATHLAVARRQKAETVP